MKTKMKGATPSSGNVFADLGLEDAEAILEIADRILQGPGSSKAKLAVFLSAVRQLPAHAAQKRKPTE